MSQNAIDIRALTPADAEVWRLIRLEALANAPEAFGESLEHASTQPTEYFAKDVAGRDPIFAAFAGDRAVGTAGFRKLDGPKQRHRGNLWGMYVAPDFRGQRVGHRLIEAVIAHARQHVVQLHLHVVVRNAPAYNLYRSMGFTAYGIEPRALRYNGRDEDEALMVLMLDRNDVLRGG